LIGRNKEAWILYNLCKTQLRFVNGLLVGFDYNAIINIAKIYCIELNPFIFNKIRYLEQLEIKENSKKIGN